MLKIDEPRRKFLATPLRVASCCDPIEEDRLVSQVERGWNSPARVSESSSQWVISQWVTSGTGGCGGGGSGAGRAVDVRRPSSSLDQTPPTTGSVDRPAAVSRSHRLAVKNYPPTRTRLPSGLSPVRRRRLPRSNPSTSWTYLPIRQQVTLLFR